jgi:histidinol phosphatase-like PHP family hydrolase
MKLFDVHSHNGYSRCVKKVWSPESGALKAKQLQIHGHQIIGFGITNHVHFNSPDQQYLIELRKKIDSASKNHPDLQILMGVELDIDGKDGKFTLSQDSMNMLDYVIAGPHNQVHRSLAWDLDEDELEDYFSSLSDCILNSLEKNPINVWVHPFLQELDAYGDLFWERLEPILDSALKILDHKKIAIEINGSWYREKHEPLIENWTEKWQSIQTFNEEIYNRLRYIYKQAAAYENIKFSFGSDSHSIEDLFDILNCVKEFENLGLKESRVFIPKKKEE